MDDYSLCIKLQNQLFRKEFFFLYVLVSRAMLPIHGPCRKVVAIIKSAFMHALFTLLQNYPTHFNSESPYSGGLQRRSREQWGKKIRLSSPIWILFVEGISLASSWYFIMYPKYYSKIHVLHLDTQIKGGCYRVVSLPQSWRAKQPHIIYLKLVNSMASNISWYLYWY